MEWIPALAIGAMFGIGLFQLLRRNLIRSVIGLVVLSNAVNLFLLATGSSQGVSAAYANLAGPRSDALPQALVLTAIVISLGGFALVLAMVYLLSVRWSTSDSDEVSRLRH
jgi:multicomponent Na+:H+ antiporter subunit C